MSPTATGLVPGMQTILNAVENASTAPVTSDDIIAVLRGHRGHSSHMRAIFGDVSLRVLDQVGSSATIDLTTILSAYETARTTVAAANGELDLFLAARKP